MVTILEDKLGIFYPTVFPNGKVFLFYTVRRTAGMTDNNFQEAIDRLEKMLEPMKYGSITLVIQDGKIIQLEKNEKLRLK
jgi:hypothetical protein